MKVIGDGVAAASVEGTFRQSCAFGSICVLESGRWVVGFRAAPTKVGTAGQRSMICWSDDEGATWSEPIEPFTPPDIDGKAGLFRTVTLTALDGNNVLAALYWVDHSDPTRPFFNQATKGLLDSRVFLSHSDDGGATWSTPVYVDVAPFDVPVALTGPVQVFANGDWGCQFELNKHFDDTTEWRHAPVILFSSDQGRSWGDHAYPAHDESNRLFYWDQRPTVLPDGKVLDVFWTFDNGTNDYRNIHAASSEDHGRTWSPAWDTEVPGQPAAPVVLDDGHIVMVYVDRSGEPAIRLRISEDGGRTWPQASELTLYELSARQSGEKTSLQAAWTEMEAFSLGLPATARTAQGDVVAIFYAGTHTDHTDIRWVQIRP